MNNLHSIKPSINLTEQELSVIWYSLTFGRQHRFRIRNNALEYASGATRWLNVLKNWNIPLTMRDWIKMGKPMPELTGITIE